MELFFPLYTQLINLTLSDLSFPVDDDGGGGLPFFRKLPRGKTQSANQYRLLRRLGELDPASRIRVKRDGEFTGIELNPKPLLKYVRLIIYLDGDDALCVGGVRENGWDILFRHRYVGCMRNIYWNRRQVEPIARSEPVLPTDLRNVEGCSQSQHLASSVDIFSQISNPSSPVCMLSPPVYMACSGCGRLHGSGGPISSSSSSLSSSDGGISASVGNMSFSSYEGNVESITGETGDLICKDWSTYDNTKVQLNTMFETDGEGTKIMKHTGGSRLVKEMGFPINDVLSEVFEATKEDDYIDKISRFVEAEVRERVVEISRKLPPGVSEVPKIDIIKTYQDVVEGLSEREAQAEREAKEAIQAQLREMHVTIEQLMSQLNGR